MATKKVVVTAKMPQVKPAHHAIQTKQGEGTTYRSAIGRALEAILEQPHMKGKRNLLPMTLTVQDAETIGHD